MERSLIPACLLLLVGGAWPCAGLVPPTAAHAEPTTESTSGESETEEALAEVEEELQTLRQRVEAQRAGDTRFLVTGWGFSGFADDEESSSFTAGVNPILLWKVSDRVFFEAEPEIELEGDATEVGLEFADISLILNRYATFTAGLFLTPLGAFNERLHPAWINKLPDAPLAFGHDGLLPGSSLGIQLRGGAAVGSGKLNYSVFVVNGPQLNDGEEEPEEAGMLEGGNFDDNNDGKSIGGRVGFLPVPNLEIGLGLMNGKAGARDTASRDLNGRIEAVDLAYFKTFDAIKGTLDVRAEWLRSTVDRGEGVLDFDNERTGGYAQLAYRPSSASGRFLKKLEGAVRFDFLNRPVGAPENLDEDRWTYGLTYWLNASTALKIAYQANEITAPAGGDDEEVEETGSRDTLLFQVAVGF